MIESTDDPGIILGDRHRCAHLQAGEKSLRCPTCRGIMRRCCQTALGTKHRADCEEYQWEPPVRVGQPR